MNQKTALLIIDVQVALFSCENLKLHNEEKVLDHIEALLHQARKAKMPIVYIQHTEKSGDFKRGANTWQLHPRLSPKNGEAVIEKTTWDAFHNTGLHKHLQDEGIQHLIIAGMQTEFCLDTSCRRAYSMGYRNTLIKDAHTTFDSGVLKGSQIIDHHNSVLGGRFVELKTFNDMALKLETLSQSTSD